MITGMARLKHLFPFSSSRAQSRIKELFGNTEKVDRETVLALDKKLLDQKKEEDEHKTKINNYHYYQYFRGEDFIENIPYSQNFKYTLRDSIEEQKQKERVSVQELQPITNHLERTRIIRQRINAYHDKQKKYEIQQFQKYLSQYPGTVKGPRPEDDWEAYRDYALKKMPRVLKEQISFQQAEIKARQNLKKDNENEDEDFQPPKIQSTQTLLDQLSSDRILLDQESTSKEEQNAWFKEFEEGWEHQQMANDSKLDVPVIPSLNFENYQHFMQYWMGWLSFRNSYTDYNYDRQMKKLQDDMQKLCESLLQEEESEWAEVESNIPSLYRYYKCLPKSLQDHPGMKDIYLGLEYTSPDFSNEDKENALNYVCTKLLPFDDISSKVMDDYTAHAKVRISRYIHDKIFTMPPQFTYDLNVFMDQLRKQELRGQTSNENKDLKFPEPPEVHTRWEEGAPNLPVDFYDNEDGFWDSTIKEKLRRYDAHKPMLKTRRFFTH